MAGRTNSTEALVRYEAELCEGTYLERPNRFTVLVDLDGREQRVYLRNTGGLETTLEPGRTVLCRPAASDDRVTDYDAIAVDVAGTWVTVDATLPNELFERCVTRSLLPRFDSYRLEAREPPLPGEGRTDVLLETPTGTDAYVEVKSNTYVVDGISKFPDRPTKRGRRHLRSLTTLVEDGFECHVVFVVQRPDASRLRPFREVDPEFADLLARAHEAGVEVSALTTAFDPPSVTLANRDLPVELA